MFADYRAGFFKVNLARDQTRWCCAVSPGRVLRRAKLKWHLFSTGTVLMSCQCTTTKWHRVLQLSGIIEAGYSASEARVAA